MKSRYVFCILAAFLFHSVANAQRPLEPLDTSSPRATLSQFLGAVDEIGRAAEVYRNDPSHEAFLAMARLFQPPRNCFDLIALPETARREHGGEAIVLLWEVLSRIELPPNELIPDRAAMREMVAKGEPDRWTIPHTEITLARVQEGEHAGEYLFSPSTVERLPQFYRSVEKLPYVREMTINNPRRLHKLWAGWMMSPRLVEAMPGWLIAEIGDQVIWKWVAVVLLLAVLLFATWKLQQWAGRLMRTHSLGQYLRPLATPAIFLALMPSIEYMLRVQVGITGVATDLVQGLLPAMTYLAVAWLTWQIALFIAEIVISSPRIPAQGLNAHLLRLVARVVGLVGVLVVLFWGGTGLGYPCMV